MFWDYEIVHSSIKTTATKTLTFYNDVLFISKTSARVSSGFRTRKNFENTDYPNQSRCMAPPDWLRTTMARIVPSLQLAKTEDHSYTFNCYTLHLTPYTLHLTSYTLQVVREFFCIKHSSRGTILCRLASRASSLGWLVGKNSPKKENALIGEKSCLYNSMETQN